MIVLVVSSFLGRFGSQLEDSEKGGTYIRKIQGSKREKKRPF